MSETADDPSRRSIPEAKPREPEESPLDVTISSSQHSIPEKQDDSDRLATSGDTSSSPSPSASPPPSRRASASASLNRVWSEVNGRRIIFFDEDDPTNPYNWRIPKKMYVVITCMLMVLNSTTGSSLPSGATRVVQKYFHVESDELLVLPISIYLIGYILGPMIFAPLSESYGRKIVMICTFTVFTCFVMATALSPNFTSMVIFRLFAGIGASTPVSVIGGIYADLYNTPRARGIAIMAFMAGTTWGPLCGPLISGYVSEGVSWQWVYWIELIAAGATWPFLLCMPETYGPVILKRKARKMRKESGNPNIAAQAEVEKQDLWEIVSVVLTRPVRMFLFEAIVLCTCLYLSLAYGVFYIYFQAYDPIFNGVYGFSPGQVGLCFLPIGIGSLIAAAMYLWYDWFLEKARRRESPPAWSQKEEFNRLPLACVGGPLFVVSFFWLGWTARPDIHWIVPVMSALPFGIGFLCIFFALINYVVDAYEVFAASAMGATSATRSTFGVVLPFAAKPMYSTLGVNWACTLLGLLSALMSIIPFVFIKYGQRIRDNSAFCQALKKKKAEDEETQQRRWERQRQRAPVNPEKAV